MQRSPLERDGSETTGNKVPPRFFGRGGKSSDAKMTLGERRVRNYGKQRTSEEGVLMQKRLIGKESVPPRKLSGTSAHGCRPPRSGSVMTRAALHCFALHFATLRLSLLRSRGLWSTHLVCSMCGVYTLLLSLLFLRVGNVESMLTQFAAAPPFPWEVIVPSSGTLFANHLGRRTEGSRDSVSHLSYHCHFACPLRLTSSSV